MNWKVHIERKALKALKKIPNPYKFNITDSLEKLSEDPRPSGCVKLKGADDLCRIRVNDYRIIYQIKNEELLILVVRIGHRGDIYEGL